jgi:hypothetical protein
MSVLIGLVVGVLILSLIIIIINNSPNNSYGSKCDLISGEIIVSDIHLIDEFATPTTASGQKIWSPNGTYTLIIQSDGNLVLYDGSSTNIWQSNTTDKGTAPYKAVMESTGNFVVYDKNNTNLWSTGTSTANSKLTLDNNGLIKILDSTNKLLWVSNCGSLVTGPFTANCLKQWWSGVGCTTDITQNTNYSSWLASTQYQSVLQGTFNQLMSTRDETSSQACYGKSVYDQYKMNTLDSGKQLKRGQSIWSLSNVYKLTLTTTGRLVLYDGTLNEKWSNTTVAGSSSSYTLNMLASGNLTLLDASGNLVFQSGTSVPGSYLTVDNNGFIKIIDSSNNIYWVNKCEDVPVGPYSRACLDKWWNQQGCRTNFLLSADISSYQNIPQSQVLSSMTTTTQTQTDAAAQQCYGFGGLADMSIPVGNSTGFCLDLYANDATNGKILNINPCTTNIAQKWLFKNNNIKLYRDQTKCLEAVAGNTANGTQIGINTCDNSDKQNWIFDPENKTFRSKLNTNKCIDVPNNNLANNQTIQLYDCNGATAQKWTVKPSTLILSKMSLGSTLTSSGAITSPNGVYSLKIASTGNLQLTKVSDGSVLWTTSITTSLPTTLSVQPSGDMILKDSSNTTLWSTGTSGTANSVVVEDLGYFRVIDSSYNTLWLSNCDIPQNGPYLFSCLKNWWSQKGCTVDLSTINVGNSTGDTDYTNKTLWNAKSQANVKSDMALWSTTQDQTHSKTCYNMDAVDKYKISILANGSSIKSTTSVSGQLGQRLWSPDGTSYYLQMQNDGNLILYNSSNSSVWTSGTAGQGTAPYTLTMQTDGNLVILDSTNTVKWATGTSGSLYSNVTTYTLKVDNAGYFYVVDSSNVYQWHSSCEILTSGPYPRNCLQKWWNASGCTTTKPTTLSDVSWWNARSQADVKADMNAWATTQDQSHTPGCYNMNVQDKYDLTSTGYNGFPSLTFRIRTNSKSNSCMDDGGVTGSNDTLRSWIYSCSNGNYNQSYAYDPVTGLLYSPSKNLCVDTTGDQLHLRPCDSTNAKQIWSFNTSQNQLQNQSRCIDDGGGSDTNNTYHYLASACDNTNGNQKYALETNTVLPDRIFQVSADINVIMSGTPVVMHSYWFNKLKNSNNYSAVLQNDGNFVVYNSNGTAKWNTNTSGKGTKPYRLAMQSDGNLVLYDINKTAIWSTGTKGTGSANGRYMVILESDGVLRMYQCTANTNYYTGTCGTALWTSQ